MSATPSTREAEFVTPAGMGAQIAETEADRPAADTSMLMGRDLLPAAGTAKPEALTYIVQPGDTLWLISVKAYGRGSLWQVIFEANRDVLEDPSRIWPEQVLEIPPEP
jgi:nucleoid-associated protein YgaU